MSMSMSWNVECLTVRGAAAAGAPLAGIPAKFGSFYAQSLLSARCKPCLAANLADLWWNSRTSSTIHFPTAELQGSAPSFSNLLKSKFIHKWERAGGPGGEWEKYGKPLLVWDSSAVAPSTPRNSANFSFVHLIREALKKKI